MVQLRLVLQHILGYEVAASDYLVTLFAYAPDVPKIFGWKFHKNPEDNMLGKI